MKVYTVTMPFAGAITISVEAENEDQAKEQFYSKIEQASLFNSSELQKIDADIEWEMYEKMNSGNVCHYNHWEVEIAEE